ncbi:MAG TPA: MFS transporter [Solirubrobacter sp.]|nr:MFS transporter [Solirubrobacter sp.]
MTTSLERELPAAPGTPPRTRLILAVCCLAQFLVILDLSIVTVALPSIQSALRISAADLQWVVDAYAIVFAGFLMLAGRVSDLFGQRRTFGASLLLFAVASLAGGAAPSDGVLIVARGVQGLAGAGMAAASLAIITSTFPAGPERHRAIALWGAMNGVGGAAGTLFGGILTDTLSWRWVLLVNVPVGIGAAILAYRVVADRRAQRAGFDLAGALTLTAGLLISTYGGVTAGAEGFGSPQALVPIAIGALLLGLFVLVERRATDPLVPLASLTPELRSINLIVLLFSASLFAMWFASSLYLQQVLALSPLETGFAFLPMTVAIFLAARPAGRLSGLVGVRTVLVGGLVMLAVGLALLSRIGPGGSALQYVILPGILTAVGIGLSVVSSTIAATQSAEPGQAGLVSSVVNTSRQVGGGLGLAVLISLATQRTSGLIGDGAPVAEALTDGFRLAYLVGAGLVALAAVLTIVLLPSAGAARQRALGRRFAGAVAVATAVFVAAGVGLPRSHAALPGAYTLTGTMHFVTEPGLHPPKLLPVVKAKPSASDDYIMTANFLDVTKPPIVGQSGPMMLDHDLQPVWFKPVPKDVVAANLEVYEYDGRPVLGWWQGVVSATGEIASGEVVVVDQSYRKIATLKGAGGWIISMHAMDIRDGAAWVTANRNVPADLSREGGVNHGVLVDSALQKYDLKTGKLLYTWRASDHIPLSDSETQPPPNGFPWDAYHINSLDLTDDGRALVSMRNTSTVYLFDLDTGKIAWQLGGRSSSFRLDPEAEFEWQHDANLEDESTVTLFDNHCCEITGAGEYLPADHESRGLVLKLDTAGRTASVAKEYTHGETFHAQYMGNLQRLANGHAFVGWGQVPFMTEYSESGELLFDAALPVPNMTYRAHLRDWVGRPLSRPRAAVRRRAGKTTVLVSWNGATEVARWKVLADGRAVAERARSGFETAIDVPDGGARFEVQALDDSGRVLGTSAAVTP